MPSGEVKSWIGLLLSVIDISRICAVVLFESNKCYHVSWWYYCNSPVLHCTSPSAHNIAISKEAVIFKESIMAPFVVLMIVIAILIILPGLKGICLETCPSRLMQNDHLKPKVSLCCRFVMKQERWLAFLFVLFTSYGHTKNI